MVEYKSVLVKAEVLAKLHKIKHREELRSVNDAIEFLMLAKTK